ncbi:acetyltransferase [Paenibacillus chartarius]|uniref:Acetyltransferase n=1 Tax=Paenibacillus chartarius TaxID=747481 RepID=A0ABV6DUY4_9BACL
MDIAVVGAGGHSKVICDMIASKGYQVRALLDDRFAEVAEQNGVWCGPVSAADGLIERFNGIKFIIAIGNNAIRKKLVARLNLPNESYVTLAHETAVISPSASIGPGTVVMAHAVVQADASIGHHAIINTAAIVEHDNRTGDYVHIAPRATLTGDVRIGEGAMLGAGATVIPGMSVGEWAVVGAGATVISPIPAYCTAVGTPAKVIAKAPA